MASLLSRTKGEVLAKKRTANIGKRLINKFQDERGSATVEFVSLALPLFIPLFIFLNSYSSISDGEASLRTLARESVRAFVLAPNDETAYRVAGEVIARGAEVLGFGDELESGELTYNVECKQSPCISPDNTIRIRMTLKLENGRTVRVQSMEYVSPWV